jgi:hypothetical protein
LCANLPPEAGALIEALLGHLSQGERVAVLTADQELSPNDAAHLLGVSRPPVVHRMDIGDLPFRYVGKHRRTTLKDVLALKAKIDVQLRRWRRSPTTPKTSNSTMAFEPAVAVFDACILTSRVRSACTAWLGPWGVCSLHRCSEIRLGPLF